MRHRTLRGPPWVWLVAVACLAGLQAADAPPVRAAEPGLAVEASVAAPGGGEPRAGDTALVTLSYSEAVTGRASKGVTPTAFIRRLEAGRPACRSAAQNFRITRSLSRDDVPLFGAWIGVVHENDTVGLIDPKMDYQGANLAALAALQGRPSAILPLRQSRALAVAVPGKGEVVEFALPDLSARVRLDGLSEPAALIEGDRASLFVAENGSGELLHVDAEGKVISKLRVGPAPLGVIEVPASVRSGAGLLAWAGDGGAAWLDRAGGEPVRTFPAGSVAGGLKPVAWPGAVAVADGRNPELRIFFRDAPDDQVTVPLGAVPMAASADPRGRYVLVWSDEARRAELIDVAFGRVVQVFEIEHPVSDAVFSGDTLFVGFAGAGKLVLVELAARRTGQEALVRDARLATGASAPARVRLRALGDKGTALALVEGTNTIFVVGGGAHASPIEGTVKLEGAPARDMVVLERGLEEVADGVFTTKVRLPARGPLELVATTGVGGVTTCLPIRLSGGESAEAPPPRVERVDGGSLASGRRSVVSFRLVDLPAGSRRADHLQLTAMALAGPWRGEFTATRQPDGTYAASVVFPSPGLYPLVLLEPMGGQPVQPLVVEVGS